MSTTALVSARERVAAGRRSRFLAILMSVFALLFTAAPHVAFAAGDVVVADGSGVRGTVALADSGPDSITVVAFHLTNGQEEWYDTVVTPSGSWELPGLAAGQYVVRFVTGGYRSQCFGGDPCTPVDVVDGSVAILDLVTLVRTTPGTVGGTVLDGSGHPISAVSVHATYEGQQADAQTDAAGAWQLPGLASEVSWQVVFTKEGTAPYSSWLYPKEGRTVDAGVVMLVHPGSVAGTVRDSSGNGIAGALVYLRPTDGTTSTHVLTGADGKYSFDTVIPRRYRVFVTADGHPDTYYPQVQNSEDATVISVTEGRLVSGADVTAPTGVTIAGHLKDGAGSLGGGALLHEQGAGPSLFDWAPDGAYSFTDRWPGTYTVRAEADGHRATWLGDSPTEQDATWLTLTSGQQRLDNDITLPVTHTYLAQGTVQSAAGSVAQLTVRLGDVEGLTDADGNFSVLVDHAGSYPVQVSAGTGQICGGDAPACPTPTVSVPAAGIDNLVITVPSIGSLAGDLLLPNGTPSDGGVLTVTNAAGTVVATYEFGGELNYLLLGLPFGDYILSFVVDGLARFSEPVTIDGAVTRDIAAVPGFGVSGTVTLAQAESWVKVTALDASGEEAASYWIDTPGSGISTYQMGRLNAGDYTVGVQTSSGRWAWYPSGSDPRSATPVTITGADRTGIDFAVPAVANVHAVTGRIVLPAGTPGASATDLDTWFESDATGREYHPGVHADGTYRVDLPKGTYRVRVGPSVDLWTAPLAEDLEVTGPTTRDLHILPGGSVTGRLVDPEGLGAVGRVWVTAGAVTLGSVQPNTWGYWTLGPLAAGTVSLHVAADGLVAPAARTVTVASGQVTDAGVQQLSGAGRLAVRIPDLGDGVKVTVVVTDPTGTRLVSKGLWSGESARIDGIPAGPVLVRFEGGQTAMEWWKEAATRADATPVAIVTGETTSTIVPRLTLTAPPADGTLSGIITNHTGQTGALHVQVVGSAGRQTVAVQGDGTYAVQLPPGTYKVKATLCVGYWMGDSGCVGDTVVLWYPGSDATYARSVTVTSQKVTGAVNIDVGGPLAFRSAPRPTFSGPAVVGGTLTATAGTWSPAPTGMAYQWLRGGVAIPGATGPTYLLTADDLGSAITVATTGTKDGYRTTRLTSSASALVAGASITPGTVTVTGSATVGSTLTALHGSWTPSSVALAYQWLRDGAAIGGATAVTHRVEPVDAGTRVSVRVTGTKAGFITAAATSGAVSVPLLRLTATPVPTVSGSAKVGATLTAVPGSWGPGLVGLAYQWLRNGTVIGGATGRTRLVVGADVGTSLAVRVTGSAPHYQAVQRTSAATAKVPSGKMTTKNPTISGTPKVGRVLTAKVSGWKPTDTTFRYVWYRSGKTIKGATARTYTAVAADVGKTIKVKVTGSAIGYPSASATSKSTKKVAKGTIVPGTTVIEGVAKVGQVVRLRTTGWQPTGVKFSYQWYRAGKAISKARASTYTVRGADLGRKLTIKVTATLAGYKTVSKTSKATAAVVA